MPPRKKQASESKVGLIVTLIFFILLSIGLGVATYYGFTEQANLTKLKEDADKQTAVFKAERDWYRIQANIFRSFFNNPPKDPAHLEEMRLGMDAIIKKAPRAPGEGQKDKDDVYSFIAELIKLFDNSWDPSKDNTPKRTVPTLLKENKDRIVTLEKAAAQSKEAEAATAEKLANKEKELAKGKEDFAAATKKQADDSAKDREKDRTAIDQARAFAEEQNKRAEAMSNELAKQQKQLDNTKTAAKTAETKLAVATKDLLASKEQVADLSAQNRVLMDKLGSDTNKVQAEVYDAQALEALKQWKKPWRIIHMNRDGKKPYINLGTDDKVVPQLTFSVHARGLDGRPSPIAKGTVEIVTVIDAHTSQVRVTSVRDEKSDPILKDDILFNPTWDPTVQKHVAIAGIIDPDSSGRDITADFMKQLERQGVVIDAYIDTRTIEQKGKGMTVNTDYIIIGNGIDSYNDPRSRNNDLVKKMDTTIREMQEKARANGVKIIGFRKYMELAGYRN
jgi:hypothetical protein